MAEGGRESDADRANYIRREIGISLRDFFAAHALEGFVGSYATPPKPDGVAAQCYAYADAMIAERSKGRGS